MQFSPMPPSRFLHFLRRFDSAFLIYGRPLEALGAIPIRVERDTHVLGLQDDGPFIQ